MTLTERQLRGIAFMPDGRRFVAVGDEGAAFFGRDDFGNLFDLLDHLKHFFVVVLAQREGHSADAGRSRFAHRNGVDVAQGTGRGLVTERAGHAQTGTTVREIVYIRLATHHVEQNGRVVMYTRITDTVDPDAILRAHGYLFFCRGIVVREPRQRQQTEGRYD